MGFAEPVSADGGTFSPDLQQYLRILWRRRWAFIACLILIPAASLAYSLQSASVYQSNVLMQVSGGAVDPAAPAPTVGQAPNPTVVNVAARLIRTTAVARAAARALSPAPADPGALLRSITTTADDTAGFLTLTASDHDSQRAAAIANAFAQAVVQNQVANAVRTLDSGISQLQAQFVALRDLVQKRQLSAQLERLRALRAVQTSNIIVVEPAAPSGAPVSPRPLHNTIIALLIALLIGLGVVFLLDRLDGKLRDPEEIESIVGAPLLAIIPREAFRGGVGVASAVEAFGALRMGLTYFNVDKPLDTVLVTSALKAEGKTTVSVNLALAAARAGGDVILIESDLRRPTVADRLGLSGHFGMTDVLIGTVSLFDALIEYDLDPAGRAGVAEGRLRVLVCGTMPPNPSELLGSARMRALLKQVSSLTEMVVIDSAPVLAVSDAVPLITEASGVIVVSRLDSCRRDALQRLRRLIGTGGGAVFGVVVTGAGHQGIYGYGGYEDYVAASATSANGHKPGVEAPELVEHYERS